MNLKDLQKYAAACEACILHEGRNKPVFAKGNPEADIMIVGMVPADEENKLGIPFVGRAGQLLDQILLDSGLSLKSVYITNLVKCYLKAGLPLEQEWIDACLPYLITQVGLIRPKVILSLGKDATFTLLGLDNKLTLGKVRGELFNFNDIIRVVPTYHPSYLLRGGGPQHKSYSTVVGDFLKAREISLDK
jgi:DNA polymerase